MIVECSDLDEEEKQFLDENCNYVLNLWNKKELHSDIFGRSKSLGEGTMTIEALKYISDQNLHYNYLYKISGRYWLNNNFELKKIQSNVFKKINNDINNIYTALYKISKENSMKLLTFLLNNVMHMKQCVGYEVLMSHFVKTINVEFIDEIGLSGLVTICGREHNG
jgi:hypothetical protein